MNRLDAIERLLGVLADNAAGSRFNYTHDDKGFIASVVRGGELLSSVAVTSTEASSHEEVQRLMFDELVGRVIVRRNAMSMALGEVGAETPDTEVTP